MTTKIKVDKIVEAMKAAVKQEKQVSKSPKTPFNPAIKPTSGVIIRDMRQEAKDLGSHGASEYFKEGDSNGPV